MQSQQVLEWQAERELEAKVGYLIRILEVKFTSIPEELANAIRATTDIDKVDGRLPFAVRCTSPEDFRQAAGL